MPKYLYLMRHAQSAEKRVGESDKERELTSEGVRQSLLVGSYCLKNKIIPEIVYTSTARRALSTATLFADAIKIDPEKIVSDEELFQASARTFQDLIHQTDEGLQSIMYVAHNPTISHLAEYITKSEIGELVPAGFVIIKLSCNSWSELDGGKGEFINYIYPGMLIND